MILKHELHSGMGTSIIELLNKLETLPETGIVAGQAVTSALIRLYGSGQEAPINDIDYYVEAEAPRQVLDLAFNPMNISVCPQDYDGKKQFYNPVVQQLFDISRVSHEGAGKLINKVECVCDKPNIYQDASVRNMPKSFPLTAQKVIQSFDLNAVQAGVDLRTKQLVWTPAFQEFMQGGELLVAQASSPFHTMGRMLKKQAEMPWLFSKTDINIHALLLPFAIETHEAGWYSSGNLKIPKFGKKYFDLFQQHPELQHWFEITKDTAVLSTKSKKRKYVPDLYTATLRKEKLDETLVSEFAAHVRGISVYNGKNTGVLKLIAKGISPSWMQDKVKIKGTAFQTKSAYVQKHWYFNGCMQVQGSRYVEGQVLPDIAEDMESYLQKHPGLRAVVAALTFTEQRQALANIKGIEKEFGTIALGIIETATRLTGKDCLDMPNLQTWVKATKTELMQPLDVVPLGIVHPHLKELLSTWEIKREGEVMHHCVGGYVSKVRDGFCRIISVTTGDTRLDKSTVELVAAGTSKISSDETLRIAQHRGFSNAVPPASHVAVITEWLSQYNQAVLTRKLNTLNTQLLKRTGQSIVVERMQAQGLTAVETQWTCEFMEWTEELWNRFFAGARAKPKDAQVRGLIHVKNQHLALNWLVVVVDLKNNSRVVQGYEADSKRVEELPVPALLQTTLLQILISQNQAGS